MYTSYRVLFKYVFQKSWVLDLALLVIIFGFLGVPYPQEIATEYICPWQNRLELLGALTCYYAAKGLLLATYWELILGIKIK
jgi:hypothetical protein